MRVKKMKFKVLFSTMIFTLLTILCLNSVNAQAPGGMQMKTPEERATAITDKMKTELSLTDAQVPQVSAINLKYAQKADSLFKAPGDRSEKMPAMQSLQQSKAAELKGILTPDQYTKYEAMVKEMMDKAKAMYHN